MTNPNTYLLKKYIPPDYIAKAINQKFIPKFFFPLRNYPYSFPQNSGIDIPILNVESQRDALSTPIHGFKLPNQKTYLIKRDDYSGLLLSGNKVRKLEFIISKALEEGYDAIATIGGSQSNHCRATAVAARLANIECHLILREDSEFNMSGNLFLDALMDAKIHTVTREEYKANGQIKLLNELKNRLLIENGKKVLIIPAGGSDATGIFGYIECFDEIYRQLGEEKMKSLKYIVSSTGSGGTLSGLSIACALSGLSIKVVGIAVCDNANYFYDHVDEMLEELELSDRFKARDIVEVIDSYKGIGYAQSTKEELELLFNISRDQAIIFDPVYTLKAINGLYSEEKFGIEPQNTLFIHTGGLYGVWSKANQMESENIISKPTPLFSKKE